MPRYGKDTLCIWQGHKFNTKKVKYLIQYNMICLPIFKYPCIINVRGLLEIPKQQGVSTKKQNTRIFYSKDLQINADTHAHM